MYKREESQRQTDERKVYATPEITHELELETRAGSSPLGMPDPLDPSGGNE